MDDQEREAREQAIAAEQQRAEEARQAEEARLAGTTPPTTEEPEVEQEKYDGGPVPRSGN